MKISEKTNKYETISEYLISKNRNPNLTIIDGIIKEKKSSKPWSIEDEKKLNSLLKKFSIGAIRKKAWRMLNSITKK